MEVPPRASLLPKLRDHYAEFLDHVSLVHLRLLALPTCVGLRYGRRVASPQSFSCVSTPKDSDRPKPPLALPSRRPRLPPSSPTRLDGHVHQAAPSSFHGPSALQRQRTGQECSPARHRLRLWGLALGSASPCADCHGAGILGLPVCGVFTRICAYSFRHPHFPPLHPQVSTGASQLRERSPTPDAGRTMHQGQASAGRLIPTILGAVTLDE